MNYLLLALATAVAFIALLLTADILRVASGKANFNSFAGAVLHVISAAGFIIFAVWLFQTAVAA
jgi:putative Ca2+/H+ antiporter (TMEM165/GDT1 family)